MKLEESLSTSSEEKQITKKKRKREKTFQKEKRISFKNPSSIKYLKDISTDCFSNILDNTFCVFISVVQNISYLVYATKSHSIISYNISNDQKLCEIKEAHEKYITFFKHYFDRINYRDIIISISSHDNNLKLWNLRNWDCILNLENINQDGDLYSSCLLCYNNQNYILTSNCYGINGFNEPIKLYNLKGKKIREIKESKHSTVFIDIYTDKINGKKYIITGNEGFVKSYDFSRDKTYFKYEDISAKTKKSKKKAKKSHFSVIINDLKKIVNLIESSEDNIIRIWNFHYGELIYKIFIEDNLLFGLCLWNMNKLFVACSTGIKLVNLDNGDIVKTLSEHKNSVICVKKIWMEKYGECLISQDELEGNIKLWIIKKYNKLEFNK